MPDGHDGPIPTSVVVPSLVRCGVSPDADLVYRTLMSFGPRTSGGAARELGMPQRRVVQAFEELVARISTSSAPGSGSPNSCRSSS